MPRAEGQVFKLEPVGEPLILAITYENEFCRETQGERVNRKKTRRCSKEKGNLARPPAPVRHKKVAKQAV